MEVSCKQFRLRSKCTGIIFVLFPHRLLDNRTTHLGVGIRLDAQLPSDPVPVSASQGEIVAGHFFQLLGACSGSKISGQE